MKTIFAFLLLSVTICIAEIPRPDMKVETTTPGHCALTFLNSCPGGVAQIQRLACGRRDTQWTLPAMLMNRYQIVNKPEMCRFDDTGLALNVTYCYRIRWFNGTEVSQWSKKVFLSTP